MNIWVCRTGKNGEYEDYFLQNNKICLTREYLTFNLSNKNKEEIKEILTDNIEKQNKTTISNVWSQIDIFINRMKIGDTVIIPQKKSSLIHVAKIIGDYTFEDTNNILGRHYRKIRIIAKDIDAYDFPQSLQYSLGAYRTIFQIKKADTMQLQLKKKGVSLNEV